MLTIVGHELAADLTALIRNGYKLPDATYFDSYVAARWCWPDLPDGSYGLEPMALRETSMPQWRPTLGKLDIEDFDSMSDDVLARRCGGDAEASIRLKEVLAPEIKRLKLTRVWDMAMSVLPILADIGGVGMHVNREELEKRASITEETGLGTWLLKETTELERMLGIENLNSREQLGKALYTKKGATPLYKTKSGDWSVDRLSLYWARKEARGNADLSALLDRLLEYGTKEKLQSTYYVPWASGISPHNRVHSIYSLGRTATGRLSSYEFNLQNLPEECREMVTPSPGYDYIVSADHGMLELRTMAEITGDPVLTSWISEGRDVHGLMAARVAGLPELKTKADFDRFKLEHNAERQAGKKANFASIYGVSAGSLAHQLFLESDGTIWLPAAEMQKYIDTIFRTWGGYTQWARDLWYKIHRNEWVTSPMGRRWQFLPNEAGWRKARNYPIQSMASDLTLLGLRSLWYTLKRYGWKSRIIGTIHDSIVLETTKTELRALAALIRDKLEHPDTRAFGVTLRIPLVVDVKAGPTLAALETV